METAKELIKGNVARCIKPITKEENYVIAPEYNWSENDFKEFQEKFNVLLPEALSYFEKPKNGHTIAEEHFFDRGTITVVCLSNNPIAKLYRMVVEERLYRRKQEVNQVA